MNRGKICLSGGSEKIDFGSVDSGRFQRDLKRKIDLGDRRYNRRRVWRIVGFFVFLFFCLIGIVGYMFLSEERVFFAPEENAVFTDGFEDFVFSGEGDYLWEVGSAYGELKSLKISGYVEGEVGSGVSVFLVDGEEEILVFEKVLDNGDVLLSPEDFVKDGESVGEEEIVKESESAGVDAGEESVDGEVEEGFVDEPVVKEEVVEAPVVKEEVEDTVVGEEVLPEEDVVVSEEKEIAKEIVFFEFLDFCSDSCELPSGIEGEEYVLKVAFEGVVNQIEVLDLTYEISKEDVPPVEEIPPLPLAGGPGNDFKIQRGTFLMAAGSLTRSIVEGVDFTACTGPCFVKHVSSRNSGMGRTSGGGNQNFDDFETYVSDDSGLSSVGGSVVFQRNGVSNNNRITWEIWEYAGPVGGNNEMQILNTGVCTFVSGSLTCDGLNVFGGASDNLDVLVFVTGHGNPDTGRNNGQLCWVTSEWVSGSNIPRFRRGESGNNCDVSYAVVEFTGVNWNVQRAEHIFSSAIVQTETITDVVDISKSFFHTQQRNNAGNSFDGLCQSGSEVELVGTTTLEYRLPQATTNWGPDMTAVTWVVWNTQLGGQEMIVNHYNSIKLTSSIEEDNWQETITPLTYTVSETAVGGLSGQSSGCGVAFPRSYVSSRLTNLNTIDFWQSDSSQQVQDYVFQVIEFPTASLPNSAPTIVIIDPITPVTLISGGTTPVTVMFTAEDLDGASDLEDTTASVSFFRSGEATRTSFPGTCIGSFTANPNQRDYTCSVDMNYFDDDGVAGIDGWDVTVSVDDLQLETGTLTNTNFLTVNLLQSIVLSPTVIDFPKVVRGGGNIPSSLDTTVTNLGNFDTTTDGFVKITATDLVGAATPSEIIEAFRFNAADTSLDSCIAGTTLDIVETDIPSVVLSRGDGTGGNNVGAIDFCLTSVPDSNAISPQFYSASDSNVPPNPWSISILVVPLAIRRRKKKKKSRLEDLNNEFREKYGVGFEELVGLVKNKEIKKEIVIPVSIFSQGLSPSEAVSKYMHEQKGMKFSEIAKVIGRDQRSVWGSYRNACKKKKGKLKISGKEFLPVDIFRDRELSILEAIVIYMSERGMSVVEISKLLGKASSSMWTVYRRGLRKIGERDSN
jgi:DNA-directed RNA polymerase specialized sigma24 family protein